MNENVKERISTSIASIQETKNDIYNALDAFLKNNKVPDSETGSYYNYDLSGNLKNFSEVLTNIFLELQEDKNVIYGRLQDVLTTDQSLMNKSLGELYLYIEKLINTNDPYYSQYINFIQGTLTTVAIPRTVSKIKSRLLEDSPETIGITWDGGALLNNGVDLEFASYALYNSAIRNFAVPFRTKKVDSTSFQNMANLQTVRWYSDIDIPKEAFLNSSITNFYIQNTSNIKKIGEKAFLNTPLSLINLNKIEEIEAQAFYELTNTISIELPKTLKILGKYAFAQNNISNLIIDGNNLQMSTGCFQGSNIDYLEIKEGITELGVDCFNGSSINNIIILPDSLKIIDSYCFAYSLLKGISFNDSLEKIGSSCFNAINSPDLIIELSDSINEIGEYCFANSILHSVKNVTRVPSYMFSATEISEVTFSINNPPTRIEDYGFENTYNLYSLDCASIEEIGIGAFAYSSINKFIFSEKLKKVEEYAFDETGWDNIDTGNKIYYNGSLKQWCEINFLPETQIFQSYNNYQTELYINDILIENVSQTLNETIEDEKITQITGACFEYYWSLKFVSLPYLNYLGDYCFSYCENLKTIILGSEEHPIETMGEYPLAGISGATITIYTTIENFEENKYEKLGALEDCTIEVRVVN